MMPFNETMWKRIYEEDILYNSYILRNDIDPNGFFKTKEDLKDSEKADQKINREYNQTFDKNRQNKNNKEEISDEILREQLKKQHTGNTQYDEYK